MINEYLGICESMQSRGPRGPREQRLVINSPGKKSKQATKKKTKRAPEEKKCEIVPTSLRTSDFTTRQGSSMYASNVSFNSVSQEDVEIGSLQQDHSSVKEEAKCEVSASQPSSSRAMPPNAPMNTSNTSNPDPDDSI